MVDVRWNSQALLVFLKLQPSEEGKGGGYCGVGLAISGVFPRRTLVHLASSGEPPPLPGEKEKTHPLFVKGSSYSATGSWMVEMVSCRSNVKGRVQLPWMRQRPHNSESLNG
ncbi:hypothetical protein VNO77_22966 [Canavalia gladiata]|uniref:Uncharacterized protein n=1 Tax=Canavalia gladiata TaxID=3824 RepID=A0AAN9L3L1_CANGL